MKQTVFGAMLLAVVTLLTSSHVLFAGSKTLKIAMILWRGETEGEKGFKDGLKALGYSVNYTTMTAGQDRKELGRLLREELEPKINNFDYVYTFGTTVSLATKTIVNDRVPQIFGIVTDPIEAKLVPSLESSGGNISGNSNGIPVSVQIDMVLKIIPIKRLGVLFNPREQNSMAMRQGIIDLSKKLDFEVIDLRSPPTQDILQENLQKLMDKSVVVDAIYLLTDSFLLSNAKLIGDQLRTTKVKSFGAVKDFVDNGALMGLVADYYELGKATASIVDRHQKGEKLQNIPVITVKEPVFVINKTTAHLLTVTFPEDVLKRAVVVE